MGKRIAGFFAGFVSSAVIQIVLGLVMMYILGTKGMVQPETYAPTAIWLGISLALAVVGSYIGGVLARMIGKDRVTIFIYLGVIVLFAAWGIVASMAPKPEVPKGMPEASMEMSPFIASFYAQLNMPKWMVYASSIVQLVGVAIGGLTKDDFVKSQPTEQPGT